MKVVEVSKGTTGARKKNTKTGMLTANQKTGGLSFLSILLWKTAYQITE